MRNANINFDTTYLYLAVLGIFQRFVPICCVSSAAPPPEEDESQFVTVGTCAYECDTWVGGWVVGWVGGCVGGLVGA